MELERDVKSDRLNHEVVLYKGCTLNELLKIGALSFVSSVISLVLLSLLFFQSFMLGFIIGIPVSFFVGLLLVKKLQRLKRDKPYGYYEQCLRVTLEKYGISSPYLTRSGKWSVARKIK